MQNARMRVPPMREMTSSDRRFVVPTWARAASYGVELARRFDLVDALLTRSRVLCIATDERTVHAWCSGLGDVLHFVYVAPELRRGGLARMLLAEMFGAAGPRVVTHETPRGLAPRAKLNPYLLASQLAEREAS